MKFKIILPPSKYPQYLYVETDGLYNLEQGSDEDGTITRLYMASYKKDICIEFETHEVIIDHTDEP